jgi:hypothetical protein
MSYHASGEGGCENTLSCSVLACSFRIGFCAASPLPGCTRLEELSGHIFRDGLQIAGKIGTAEIRKTLDSDELGGYSCGLLSGFFSISSLLGAFVA